MRRHVQRLSYFATRPDPIAHTQPGGCGHGAYLWPSELSAVGYMRMTSHATFGCQGFPQPPQRLAGSRPVPRTRGTSD